jgi:hypothetical protein
MRLIGENSSSADKGGFPFSTAQSQSLGLIAISWLRYLAMARISLNLHFGKPLPERSQHETIYFARQAEREINNALTAQMPQFLPGLILLMTGHNTAVGTKRNDVLTAHVFHGPGPYPGPEPRFGQPMTSPRPCGK